MKETAAFYTLMLAPKKVVRGFLLFYAKPGICDKKRGEYMLKKTTQKPRIGTRQLVTMAMLSAIGIVLAIVLQFPLIPSAAFLKYDPADIPILIGGLIFGPGAGLIMTFIVAGLQELLAGSTGLIGFGMHFAATGAAVAVTSFLFKRSEGSLKSAAISIGVGCAVMVSLMVVLNLLITPIFLNVPTQTVVNMLLPAIVPFNVLRSVINGCVAFVLFRYIERAMVGFGKKGKSV
jgi:riboflavin transporter FmnP